VVLSSYFEVVYEYFDDVLRDLHCEHKLGMSFLHGVCMTVEIMKEMWKTRRRRSVLVIVRSLRVL
jgi:hypothetical protein